MTALKEKAVGMIRTLSDDNVFFIIRIMENLSPRTDDLALTKKRQARSDLQQFKGRLKIDFDKNRVIL